MKKKFIGSVMALALALSTAAALPLSVSAYDKIKCDSLNDTGDPQTSSAQYTVYVTDWLEDNNFRYELTDVYGVRFHMELDPKLEDGKTWFGGSVVITSNSTGWDQMFWGSKGNDNLIDMKEKTVTRLSKKPVFTKKEEYAGFAMEIYNYPKNKPVSVDILGKGGVVLEDVPLADGGEKPAPKKLDAPANLKATAGKGKMTLKWDAVDGAEAYRVYKYDPETKKYVKYKDIKGTKCTVSDLKKGTKYQFKVAGLKKENGKYKAGTASKAAAATAK